MTANRCVLGFPIVGCALNLGERTWIQEVVRGGAPLAARGRVVLEPGDEIVTIVSEAGDAAGVRRIFAGDES